MKLTDICTFRRTAAAFQLGALLVWFLLPASQANADDKEKKRLQNCAKVLTEILGVPDDIPKDTLDKAECVLVLPSVRKSSFLMGGSYGRGAMTCRTGKDFNGPWSAPA